MSTYVPLGQRKMVGVADTTGNNSGKWTVTFDPNALNVNVPFFEVCHIVVVGAVTSTFSVFINQAQWDTNQNGYLNSWDPSVPLPLRPGDYLYFYWSDADTDGTPPTVTIWLRYDQDILANMNAIGGKV